MHPAIYAAGLCVAVFVGYLARMRVERCRAEDEDDPMPVETFGEACRLVAEREDRIIFTEDGRMVDPLNDRSETIDIEETLLKGMKGNTPFSAPKVTLQEATAAILDFLGRNCC